MSRFVVRVTKNGGTPVTDLAPYLGAASHVVVLDAQADHFAHLHAVASDVPPSEAGMEMPAPPAHFGPVFAFSVRFPQPGRYKVWAQFAPSGQVETAAWVMDVR